MKSRIFPASLITSGVAAIAIGALALPSAFGSTARSAAPDLPPSPEQVVVQAQADAPSSQQSAVADGWITEAEYDDAIQATLACASAQGATTVSVIPRVGKARPQLTFRTPSIEEGAGIQAVVVACMAEHLDDVERVWMYTREIPTEEQAAEGARWLQECVVASANEDPVIARGLCGEEYYQEHGFWPSS